MNLRPIVCLLLGTTMLLRAQDKAATPKPAKASANPKVLTFTPSPKLPEAAPDSATTGGVIQHAPQANPMLDGPSQMVADFFASLREGKIDDGYANLTKDSKIAEKPEELKTLKAKTREAIEVFGNIAGYDFVESRAVGQRLVRATYVSQGKVFPLRWRFYFYKPENAWRLIDMRVDDKLTGIFDEVAEPKADEQKGTGAGQP